MDESTKQKFEEKLKELLEIAKAKKNVLEDVEVKAHFAGLNLEEEHMDKVYEMLEHILRALEIPEGCRAFENADGKEQHQ